MLTVQFSAALHSKNDIHRPVFLYSNQHIVAYNILFNTHNKASRVRVHQVAKRTVYGYSKFCPELKLHGESCTECPLLLRLQSLYNAAQSNPLLRQAQQILIIKFNFRSPREILLLVTDSLFNHLSNSVDACVLRPYRHKILFQGMHACNKQNPEEVI